MNIKPLIIIFKFHYSSWVFFKRLRKYKRVVCRLHARLTSFTYILNRFHLIEITVVLNVRHNSCGSTYTLSVYTTIFYDWFVIL